MRKSKNVIVISVLAAIVCIFLLKILTRDNVVKIDIGYQSVTAQTWGALILKANSIYEEKLAERFSETDFQITWHDETSGAIINENMISLKYQFGFMGDLPCLINGNKGLLMDQYNSSLLCFDGKGMEGVNQSIIVRASDGISSINELKGKNIGVPIGSSAHRMLMDLLLKNQIAEDEVTLIHTEINVGYQMLKNGYIDAMCVWEPYGAIFLSDMQFLALEDLFYSIAFYQDDYIDVSESNTAKPLYMIIKTSLFSDIGGAGVMSFPTAPITMIERKKTKMNEQDQYSRFLFQYDFVKFLRGERTIGR